MCGKVAGGARYTAANVGTWPRRNRGTAPDELALWQAATVSDREAIGRRAVDPLRDRMSGTETLEVSAPVEVTEALLTAVPDQFNARVDDVLLTALALAVARIRGPGALSIDLEGHGREEQAVPGVDLSRTVGWFTTLYPVRLDVAGVDLVDAFGGGGLPVTRSNPSRNRCVGSGQRDRLRRAPPPRSGRRTCAGRRAGPGDRLQLPR